MKWTAELILPDCRICVTARYAEQALHALRMAAAEHARAFDVAESSVWCYPIRITPICEGGAA